MNRKFKVAAFLVLIGALVIVIGHNSSDLRAQTDPNPNKEKDGKDKSGLVTDWLNDFEDCEDWRAEATCPLGDTKIRKYDGRPRPFKDGKEVDDKGKEGTFPEVSIEDEGGIQHKNNYILGVKSYFMDRGFDRVEVFPPNEYIIRGKAKEIKLWVLGRKFRHTLYVKLRDYKGRIHKLKIGRLDFWGWREMTVIIPGWLPQSSNYAVMDKNLHFVSFFVECDKFEAPGPFYFYLDQFRVITDLSEFTGDDRIKDNW